MRACTKALVVLLLTSACATPEPPVFPRGELVDLSHTYDAQTIYWPTAEGFQLRKDAEGVTPAGYYYAANSLFTSEHGGTHIDAPNPLRSGTADCGQDSARAPHRSSRGDRCHGSRATATPTIR